MGAFDYWKSLPTVTSLPNANHFDHRRLSDYSALPGCAASMVDVRASDPLNFIFFGHPGHFHSNDSPYPRYEGQPIGLHPLKQNRHSLAEEYILCLSQRTPLYHEIHQSYNGFERVYRRVLLPTVDDNDNVVTIYTAIRLNSSCKPLAA